MSNLLHWVKRVKPSFFYKFQNNSAKRWKTLKIMENFSEKKLIYWFETLKPYSFYKWQKRPRNMKYNSTNLQINLNFVCYYFSFSKEAKSAPPISSWLIAFSNYHFTSAFSFKFLYFFLNFRLREQREKYFLSSSRICINF